MLLPMWRMFINDDECAFVRIDDNDDDDDDISGWNEKKQITVSERRTNVQKRPHKICLQAHHWLKISHGKMARSLSFNRMYTRTRMPCPKSPADAIDMHTCMRKCWYRCLAAMHRIRTFLVFYFETQNQKLAGKNGFYSHFTRFRLQYMYGREYWSAAPSPPPKLHPFVLCQRLFLFVHIYFTLFCSAVTHHFSVRMIRLIQPLFGGFLLAHCSQPKIRRIQTNIQNLIGE